ncbi:hypothetical protein BGW38_005209 [Lunasporangiospora selenospora]|uniref:Uncharacterized protein n=1 Tax=Lunasporangiospora selenospora TaxID=979761 RepID=A0A9P6G3J9_9FUNG|nr:hypothetical protein BGW38_005209 [Lunasporangiospora selenospora]
MATDLYNRLPSGRVTTASALSWVFLIPASQTKVGPSEIMEIGGHPCEMTANIDSSGNFYLILERTEPLKDGESSEVSFNLAVTMDRLQKKLEDTHFKGKFRGKDVLRLKTDTLQTGLKCRERCLEVRVLISALQETASHLERLLNDSATANVEIKSPKGETLALVHCSVLMSAIPKITRFVKVVKNEEENLLHPPKRRPRRLSPERSTRLQTSKRGDEQRPIPFVVNLDDSGSFESDYDSLGPFGGGNVRDSPKAWTRSSSAKNEGGSSTPKGTSDEDDGTIGENCDEEHAEINQVDQGNSNPSRNGSDIGGPVFTSGSLPGSSLIMHHIQRKRCLSTSSTRQIWVWPSGRSTQIAIDLVEWVYLHRLPVVKDMRQWAELLEACKALDLPLLYQQCLIRLRDYINEQANPLSLVRQGDLGESTSLGKAMAKELEVAIRKNWTTTIEMNLKEVLGSIDPSGVLLRLLMKGPPPE